MLVLIVNFWHRNSESLKKYLVFFFSMALCISFWAVYIESHWIQLAYVIRVLLNAMSHLCVSKFKRVDQSHAKIVAAPIIFFTSVGAFIELLLAHCFKFEVLLEWNSIAYIIFTVPVVCLQICLFMRSRRYKVN